MRTSTMKCLIVQPIHEEGLALLREAGIECSAPASAAMADVAAAIAGCDAVITRNAGLDTRAIEAGLRLRVIGNHGTGTNMIDLAAAERLGIPVVNTPGANARSVAELALAMAMALLKRTVPLDQAVRQGNWNIRYEAGLRELSGMSLGIVGFGQIGRALAAMAIGGFGMRVHVYSPSVAPQDIAAAGCQRADSLPALAREADIVSLHRPARPGAGPLVDDALLQAMKPGALLINTARADLVDEAALARHLEAGRLGGAGLDVFSSEPPPADHPLLRLPQVVLAPHAGGSTDQALARTARAVAEQVIEVLRDARPAHLIAPHAWPRRRGAR
ncbi:Putative dehydrogenase [Bordetella bronchiseptica MO149]|nr:dehydrogenase [Bordetella bronchiseptica]CCJ58238.1 Putative dehydrogenase [Bordetella bronchiseptica MO149]AWP57846.1 dehydrogenase [Bordetella bronchiseptica]AWQ04579.1 dehydrogenase [Bordetella bronchiseptica]QET72915.1 hydroxyacid dehydrogenase [Bordetella bronchiseptica]